MGFPVVNGSRRDMDANAAKKLREIREEIKENLNKMKEENTRVCRTALGSVRKTSNKLNTRYPSTEKGVSSDFQTPVPAK